MGEYESALKSYDVALEINSTSASIFTTIGEILGPHSLRRFQDAVAAFQKALSIDKLNAHALNNLGNAYNALGKYDDALDSYNKAFAIDPTQAVQHYNRGNTLRALCEVFQVIGLNTIKRLGSR